jgi:hypothetical protein
LPRYLLIVLALAGDSTMRRFLAMAGGDSGEHRPGNPGGGKGGGRAVRRPPGQKATPGEARASVSSLF